MSIKTRKSLTVKSNENGKKKQGHKQKQNIVKNKLKKNYEKTFSKA